MNIHTFKDVVNSKRNALSNDLEDDDDDVHEVTAKDLKRQVDGEEETGDAFNDMGEAIEPFNMKNEREGGHIDENMNYVFQKEKGEVDAWVAGMDETTMEKSIGEAALAMQKKIAKQEQEDALEATKVRKTTLQVRKELLQYIRPGETLVRAMKRLSANNDAKLRGNTAFKKKTQLANQKLSGETNDTTAVIMNVDKQLLADNKQIIHAITENADQLLVAGLSGIYEMTFESIEASMYLWEYKGMDEVIYGPYTAFQLSQWKSQGYFTGDSAVLIRKCAEVQPIVVNGVSSSDSVNRNSNQNENSKKRGGGIYDDEDLSSMDQPAAKKSRVTFDNSVASVDMSISTSSDPSSSASFVKGDWLSSDDIDFNISVDLEDYDKQQIISSLKQSNKHSKNSISNFGSGSESNDNDDDSDDDGVTDPWTQKGKTKRQNRRVNSEADGDSDDEE